MPGARRVTYWDACIFIAWLKNEQRTNPLDMDGVAYLAEEFNADRSVIVTSTVTRIEVLDSTLTDQQATDFVAFLRRSTVRVVGLTSPVADLAHTIRDFYQAPRLGTPDAIHVATAIAEGCEVLYTFDGANPTSGNSRKLLSLTPPICDLHSLSIELPRRPTDNQGLLPLPPTTSGLRGR